MISSTPVTCHHRLFTSFSFSDVQNKQNQPRFLALANFFRCSPPEKPCNIVFIPSVLKRVQRWYREYGLFDLQLILNSPKCRPNNHQHHRSRQQSHSYGRNFSRRERFRCCCRQGILLPCY